MFSMGMADVDVADRPECSVVVGVVVRCGPLGVFCESVAPPGSSSSFSWWSLFGIVDVVVVLVVVCIEFLWGQRNLANSPWRVIVELTSSFL